MCYLFYFKASELKFNTNFYYSEGEIKYPLITFPLDFLL